jgi:protein TonB
MSTLSMNAASGAGMSMRAPGGKKTFNPRSRFGPVGLATMVLAHMLIGYALMTGMARQAFEMVKKPLDATIIQEVKLPPPPPPPPPPQPEIRKVTQAPKVKEPPPPAYVPPPEVAPPAMPQDPVITQVQTSQPVAPPPPAPPPVVTPEPAAPVRADIAIVCPKQVRPGMPDRAIDEGIEGTVKAQARIRNGKVVDVRVLSGPKVYHAAVRNAMLAYECSAGENEVLATQDFTFKLN